LFVIVYYFICKVKEKGSKFGVIYSLRGGEYNPVRDNFSIILKKNSIKNQIIQPSAKNLVF
jgi:hypothetical protein